MAKPAPKTRAPRRSAEQAAHPLLAQDALLSPAEARALEDGA